MNKIGVVVSRFPNGGIGDHISCLIGAWYFAKCTGRKLIIDWRGSRFNPDETFQRNCFGELFDEKSDFAGVTVISDDSVAEFDFSPPFYPEKWSIEALSNSAHLPHTSEEINSINWLATSADDRSEPTVVFNQWIHPAPPLNHIREFLSSISIAKKIRDVADQVTSSTIGECPTIAIHIRHGNGENIGHRAAYWLSPWTLIKQLKFNASVDIHAPTTHGRFSDNMPNSLIPSSDFSFWQKTFLKNIASKVQKIRSDPRLNGALPVLFCDSMTVAEELQKYLPELVVPPKTFIKSGAGPLHAITQEIGITKPIAWKTTFEMMLELELMRRCNALICMDSNFSSMTRSELNTDQIKYLRPTLVNRIVMKFARYFY